MSLVNFHLGACGLPCTCFVYQALRSRCFPPKHVRVVARFSWRSSVGRNHTLSRFGLTPLTLQCLTDAHVPPCFHPFPKTHQGGGGGNVLTHRSVEHAPRGGLPSGWVMCRGRKEECVNQTYLQAERSVPAGLYCYFRHLLLPVPMLSVSGRG